MPCPTACAPPGGALWPSNPNVSPQDAAWPGDQPTESGNERQDLKQIQPFAARSLLAGDGFATGDPEAVGG